MCIKQKKLSLLLLLMFSYFYVVFGQESVLNKAEYEEVELTNFLDSKTTLSNQEQNSKNLIDFSLMKKEMSKKQSNLPTVSLSTSLTSEMSSEEKAVILLKEQQKLINDMKISYQTLLNEKKSSEQQWMTLLENFNNKIEQTELRSKELEQCLISNKDDTHNAALVVGELTEINLNLKKELADINLLVSMYKIKLQRSYTAGTICTTIPSVLGGGYMIFEGVRNNNQAMLFTGIVIATLPSFVYQGGHWAFKFW